MSLCLPSIAAPLAAALSLTEALALSNSLRDPGCCRCCIEGNQPPTRQTGFTLTFPRGLDTCTSTSVRLYVI